MASESEPLRPDVGRLQQTWANVAYEFSKVADTCVPTGNPMETATALRAAAIALSRAADEFEVMYRGMINK